MLNFQKYFEYIKDAFKDYPRIDLEIYHQREGLMMIRIIAKISYKFIRGNLHIKFDETNISFFGSFLGDEFMEDDDFVNVWEKYSEAEIFAYLDQKIEEYKYYIANGYFFNYFDCENKRVSSLPEVIDDHKFDKELCEKVYHSFGKPSKPYSIIKTVVVSNFYGEAVETINI